MIGSDLRAVSPTTTQTALEGEHMNLTFPHYRPVHRPDTSRQRHLIEPSEVLHLVNATPTELLAALLRLQNGANFNAPQYYKIIDHSYMKTMASFTTLPMLLGTAVLG
jgi:hypothetical protein